MAGSYLEVKTTTDSKEEAEALARGVVEARLAACVQVAGPITSTYWWKGSVEQTQEWVCTMKTTSDKFEALQGLVKQLHSYETPEVIATAVSSGSSEYLEWVRRETSS